MQTSLRAPHGAAALSVIIFFATVGSSSFKGLFRLQKLSLIVKFLKQL